MKNKKLHYWIKGLLIGLTTFVVLHIIGFIITSIPIQDYILLTFSPNERFTVFSYFILIIFLVSGAVLGWLYGKFRGEKR